jgi:hypothetical protein
LLVTQPPLRYFWLQSLFPSTMYCQLAFLQILHMEELCGDNYTSHFLFQYVCCSITAWNIVCIFDHVVVSHIVDMLDLSIIKLKNVSSLSAYLRGDRQKRWHHEPHMILRCQKQCLMLPRSHLEELTVSFKVLNWAPGMLGFGKPSKKMSG